MVPWVLANPYPMVSEVMERFSYPAEKDLAKDLSLLFVCGVPGYGPGDLIMAFISDDMVVLDTADYFSRPLRLTPPEALGLLSAGMAVSSTSQASPVLEGAVKKLATAVFPDASQAIGVELPIEPEHVEALQEAVRECSVVNITYLSTTRNETTDRDIEPLIVYTSMGRWYLSAHCRLASGPRTFRIDRIKSLHRTLETFDPPPDAESPEVVYVPSADALHAVLALGRSARWVSEYYPVEVIEDRGKEMLVHFTMSDPRVAARLLVRLGGSARLVDGEEVAQELERLRSEILAGYAETG